MKVYLSGPINGCTDEEGKDDPVRREKMLEMVNEGADFSAIAAELGYKDARSARQMAHRWGLHTLLDGSYSRGPRPPFISAIYRQS